MLALWHGEKWIVKHRCTRRHLLDPDLVKTLPADTATQVSMKLNVKGRSVKEAEEPQLKGKTREGASGPHST
jgi:hypothetical protein